MSVLATDNFNRANETPLGGNWTSGGDLSTLNLISNAVSLVPPPNNDASAFRNTPAFPADHYSQVVITVTGAAGSGPGVGVTVRMATGQNYYRIALDHAATSNCQLGKQVAGTFTSLGIMTKAFSDGDTLYLEMQGTQPVSKLNGTAFGSWSTDSALASGRPGIAYSSLVTSFSLDNWEGGDFAAGGAVQTLPDTTHFPKFLLQR